MVLLAANQLQEMLIVGNELDSIAYHSCSSLGFSVYEQSSLIVA